MSIAGGLLVIVAACTPLEPILNWASGGLPYQDPTEEMLAKQAAEQAAAARNAMFWLVVAGALAAIGVALLVAGIWGVRRTRRPAGS